jgi:hypothetical protein
MARQPDTGECGTTEPEAGGIEAGGARRAFLLALGSTSAVRRAAESSRELRPRASGPTALRV